MEKMYKVVRDLQGGQFGMYRIQSIEEWREQAISWADSDENDFLIEDLENMPQDKVIEYISKVWELEFKEIDIHDLKYDYDDLKIAVCIADKFRDWSFCVDYEDIAGLTAQIKCEWEMNHIYGCLTTEEYAYIQKFANRFLENHKNEIMEELR